MRLHPWTTLRTLAGPGAILSAAVVLFACGGDDMPKPGALADTATSQPGSPAKRPGSGGTRLVLIYDPTAYLHADPSLVKRQLFEPLKGFIAGLPRNTSIDFYIVSQDGLKRPADVEAALPFEGREPNKRLHEQRAIALGDSLATVGIARWEAARQHTKQPASCILSTLRRARASLERAASANERVAIVLVSDLLEVCDDFGNFNLEKVIPDSFGPLPDRVELSDVDAIHIVELDHPSVTDVTATTKLDSLWVRLARSWGAPAEGISLRSTYPGRLFRSSATPKRFVPDESRM